MDFMKSKITSESLSQKAGSILGVFSKTISELTSVIQDATNQSAIKQEEARAAMTESEALDKVAKDNQVIVDKLKALLS